jgi:Holliday junction resolvase RusA-like endonuclease
MTEKQGCKGFIAIMPQPAVRMTGRSLWNSRSRRYLDYKSVIGIELKKTRPVCIQGEIYIRLQFHFKGACRSDIDNLFKAFTDAANNILWDDDRQIKHAQIDIIENEPVEGITYVVAGV